MNLSHRLFGVCIGILTVALYCGGCSVPKSTVSPPTAEHRSVPGRATITGITTETLAEKVRMADTSSPAPTETGVKAAAATPWLARPPGRGSVNVPGTVIRGITFDAGSGRSIVAVQTSGTPPQVQVKPQRDPTRLALDIKPARLSPTQQKALTVRDPKGVVTRLEAIPGTDGQADTVRVVIYLRTAAAFEVQQDNDVIRLAIAKSSTAAATARTPALPGSPTALASSSVPPRASRAGLPATPPVVATTARALPLMAPFVPRGVVAAVAPGGVDSAPASQRATLPPGAGLTEPSRFAGERISLDFQEADINDILRLLAEVGGVNIIAGGDVQGKVTTRMVDVPWEQALEVILKINGLAQERSGNIIRVAPLTKITQERKELSAALTEEFRAEPLVTRVLQINYATAKGLQPNVAKLLSNRGTIFIDERTNAMILTDTQKHLDDVLALVEKLDRPTPQVMIETRIVESTRDFSRALGIQLGLSYSQITDRAFPNRVDVRGGLGAPTATTPGSLVPPAAPANFLLDLPAAVAAGSGGAIGFSLMSIGGAILDAQLSALESSGRGKVIASPKIATLDNTEALIKSGSKIPYATIGAEGIKTEFLDAAISLKVTPHITPNDYISMKITATKNDRGADTPAGPIITTREANTDMLVKDGDTVVIGGLYKRTLNSARAGLPGLSNLPVIGALFRKDTEDDKSEELLIFLTPRIIRQDDATDKRRATLSY